MKKTKLIAGILLMILGVGISTGSIVLRHYGYGMMNSGHSMVNKRGMMGGYWNGGSPQKPFNVRPKQNQGKSPNPNANSQPNQNQNNGQNSNGGGTQ
jgi:hypothetical protein